MKEIEKSKMKRNPVKEAKSKVQLRHEDALNETFGKQKSLYLTSHRSSISSGVKAEFSAKT